MGLLPEWLAEAIVAAASVGVMFVLLYVIGVRESADGQLSATGGEWVLFSLVVFILVMSAVGVILALVDPEFTGD